MCFRFRFSIFYLIFSSFILNGKICIFPQFFKFLENLIHSQKQFKIFYPNMVSFAIFLKIKFRIRAAIFEFVKGSLPVKIEGFGFYKLISSWHHRHSAWYFIFVYGENLRESFFKYEKIEINWIYSNFKILKKRHYRRPKWSFRERFVRVRLLKIPFIVKKPVFFTTVFLRKCDISDIVTWSCSSQNFHVLFFLFCEDNFNCLFFKSNFSFYFA